MAGHILTIGVDGNRNWDIAVASERWALPKFHSIENGDDLFFWQSSQGLIAHARATSDAVRVAENEDLPWPDHAEQQYRCTFTFELVNQPRTPVGQGWASIQGLLGTAALARTSAIRIDQGHLEPFIQLFYQAEDQEDDLVDVGLGQLEIGRPYLRADLHADAKRRGLPPGNNTFGITVIGHDLVVFWNPFLKLYTNRWIAEPEAFEYSGEGNIGPMKENSGGNARLIAAEESGEAVHVLMKAARTGAHWTYLGTYQVSGHRRGVSAGTDGVDRADIRFQLARLSSTPINDVPRVKRLLGAQLPTENELWDAVRKDQRRSGGRRVRKRISHPDKRVSNPRITDYVNARARHFGGFCELCGRDPGWRDSDGQVHLQAHHIDPEVDLVDWVTALCGGCHDRMHHSVDAAPIAKMARNIVRSRQLELSRPVVDHPER